ncbi:hypothetical protein Efla_000338 [Eimeria flavescens]
MEREDPLLSADAHELFVHPIDKGVSADAVLLKQIQVLKESNENCKAEAERLKHRAHIVSLETQVLQKALLAILLEKRPERPQQQQQKQQQQQQQQQHQKGGCSQQQAGAPSLLRHGGRCSVLASGGPSLEKRNEFVFATIEKTKGEIRKLKGEIEAEKRLLKDTQKTCELEAAEVRREAFEFRREVIVRGEDAVSGSTIGEVLLRWLQQRQAKSSSQEEKTKRRLLKNKQEAAKQRVAVANRCSTAFNELHILQGQANLKEQLLRCSEETDKMKNALANRQAELDRTKREALLVAREKEAIKAETKRLLMQSRGNSHLPQAAELVKQKMILYVQKRLLRSWQRKLEVAQLESATVKCDLKAQAENRKRESELHTEGLA